MELNEKKKEIGRVGAECCSSLSLFFFSAYAVFSLFSCSPLNSSSLSFLVSALPEHVLCSSLLVSRVFLSAAADGRIMLPALQTLCVGLLLMTFLSSSLLLLLPRPLLLPRASSSRPLPYCCCVMALLFIIMMLHVPLLLLLLLTALTLTFFFPSSFSGPSSSLLSSACVVQLSCSLRAGACVRECH